VCSLTDSRRQFSLLKADLTNLHSTLDAVCKHLNVELPLELCSTDNRNVSQVQPNRNGHLLHVDTDEGCELSLPASPTAAHAPIDTFLGAGKPESSIDTASPHRTRKKSSAHADLISKGIISLETAQLLVQQYLTRLDLFLYALCSQYTDLESIRRASPTLLAGMCATAAFQNPEHQEVFDACNREYRHLVSASLFEKKDIEHVRALCIGSFWLPDASRILSSDAIRRAADARLQHYPSKQHAALSTATDPRDISQPHPNGREFVRLWYLLFVCDQHLSILHNRDGLMRRDLDILERRDDILLSTGCTNQDIRLLSQVSLLVIMGNIRDVLGSDSLQPVSKSLLPHFNLFTRELEQWFSRFSSVFGK
jgi:hypothetical protein